MELALLSSTIITSTGMYKVEDISRKEARELFRLYQSSYQSFIGHEATAHLLSEILRHPIKVNRKRFYHNKYQKALCFRLHQRLNEQDVVGYSRLRQMNYSFYLMTKID